MTTNHIISFILGLSFALGVYATAFIAKATKNDSKSDLSENLSASVIWSD
jgi:hypothetical protein